MEIGLALVAGGLAAVILKPGEKLRRYQLVSPIGEGGMGEVWKANDTQLGRDVALKVSKAAFTARFEQEARAIGAFNHPNICQIYDVGPVGYAGGCGLVVLKPELVSCPG
jgi:serine/threonine protein kinase